MKDITFLIVKPTELELLFKFYFFLTFGILK
jgi:hypothetical protein